MATKTDIVSLKWVIGLMNKQAENAEAALVEYGNDPAQKQPLLQCMWAVHQITSTLRALGMKKAEMLTLEMERSLNYLYKDKVVGERRKLTMGGLMQSLKVIPAYLAHTQNVRMDTGRGLEQYVNDLRRWIGERPRPQAFFFHMDIDAAVGITPDASPASDEEIQSRANVMLALYLEMAKQALRRRNVAESMKTVARISRKMQVLFTGSEPERFWFAMIGLCEGIAGGLIVPDECIAQIFKSGAFTIKYARENGARVDDSIDYDSYLQQMLYYIASCKSRPVHITGVRDVFGIDNDTVDAASRGLIHIDALVTAISGALEQLNGAVDYFNSNDLAAVAANATDAEGSEDNSALDAIEAAQHRLIAAGQISHADSLKEVQVQLQQLCGGRFKGQPQNVEKAVGDIIRGIVDVKLDLEHKLEHGLCSSFSSREFELRESVATATFTQMGLVENNLHQILRRKALKSALDKKPLDPESILHLTLALHRHLNKTDQGHEELRQAVKDADNGEPDIDLLYSLAKDYLDQLEDTPDRKAISLSLQLLSEIAGALTFAGMEREGRVIEQCHNWLTAASSAGSVHEDDAFRCFADAFAQIEMHLQRSVIDPLDDTSHMMAFAEQRAAELEKWILELSSGAEVVNVGHSRDHVVPQENTYVQDSDIPPEFREVFIEESDEIVSELAHLTALWVDNPRANQVLRDIRRHFHTFKGNGRAVGANILGELGWAAQDMLDRVLDGDLTPGDKVQQLVAQVVAALPALVMSYRNDEGPDVDHIRRLTDNCFRLARSGGQDLAEDLPHVDEVIGSAGGVADPSLISETLTH